MNISENTVFKKIKSGDVLASFIVLFAALLIFLSVSDSGRGDTVKITYGTHTLTYSLYEDREIEIENNGVKCTVTVGDGCVWVSKTDCREQICANTGKISSGCIICTPGGIIISVGGGEEDVIAG